uniref:Uncharacterized protein n=1 Tax=Crocodylus porosus TaxID=8502 RepID=A0A7M4E5U5_CROPO
MNSVQHTALKVLKAFLPSDFLLLNVKDQGRVEHLCSGGRVEVQRPALFSQCRSLLLLFLSIGCLPYWLRSGQPP